jgi:hypothetical protein
VLSSSAPLDRRHVVRSQSVMWPVMSRDICHAAFCGSSPPLSHPSSGSPVRAPRRPRPSRLRLALGITALDISTPELAAPGVARTRKRTAGKPDVHGFPRLAPQPPRTSRAPRLTCPMPHVLRASITPRLTRTTPTAFHATRAPRPPRPASPPLLSPLLTHCREHRIATCGDHAPARREQRIRREPPCALARVPRVKHARALARVRVDRGRPRARVRRTQAGDPEWPAHSRCGPACQARRRGRAGDGDTVDILNYAQLTLAVRARSLSPSAYA